MQRLLPVGRFVRSIGRILDEGRIQLRKTDRNLVGRGIITNVDKRQEGVALQRVDGSAVLERRHRDAACEANFERSDYRLVGRFPYRGPIMPVGIDAVIRVGHLVDTPIGVNHGKVTCVDILPATVWIDRRRACPLLDHRLEGAVEIRRAHGPGIEHKALDRRREVRALRHRNPKIGKRPPAR